MLQIHRRIREQRTKLHGGTMVSLLHDQDLLRNRVVREVAFHFPKSYMTARRLALQALLAKRRAQQTLGLGRHAEPSATGTAPEKLRKTA